MILTDATHSPNGASAPDLCPVSGLAVTRRREWTDVALTREYSASFALVGSRVLLSTPRSWP